MNKYKHKIPRDDLKRFAKEIAKKLVASDYKAGRVKNPTKIDERQQKKVKEFCKQFFDKAYQKHKKHEMEKATRDKGKRDANSDMSATPAGSPRAEEPSPENDDEDDDVKMSDVEDDDDAEGTPMIQSPPAEPNGLGTLKRKRLEGENGSTPTRDEDEPESIGSPSKKPNLDAETPPPPPPPPAPPMETPPASTPREGDADADVEPDSGIHADTNFKGQSMADVLAQAQAEAEEEEDEGDGDGDLVMKNGIDMAQGLDNNPLVSRQPLAGTVGDGGGGGDQ
jgi:histone-lysine N-methyltransferase SETD2